VTYVGKIYLPVCGCFLLFLIQFYIMYLICVLYFTMCLHILLVNIFCYLCFYFILMVFVFLSFMLVYV
jgi:hypothetical protein